MKRSIHFPANAALTAAAAVFLLSGVASAQVFTSSDNVLGIDVDAVVDSGAPGPEGPENVLDQDSTTKYLNFGKGGTGLIISTGVGPTNVVGLQLTAANDAPERDPVTFDLYGTNDPILSGPHSSGDLETYTLIASGSTGLDADPGREMLGSVVDFTNGQSFDAYKLIFPTLRNPIGANSMQVADVQLFQGTGGTNPIFPSASSAVPVADIGSASNYPGGENPSLALDGDPGTKYLNFANTNSGLIVSRADGEAVKVTSLTFTTANDAPGRDPLQFELYATHDPVSSPDNSLGDQENWLLVDAGSTGLEPFGTDPEGRFQTGASQPIASGEFYNAYRLVFTELRGGAGEPIMQVADVVFGGIVPEPSALLLCCFGVAALATRRRV